MVSKNVPKGAQIRNIPCGVKREKLSQFSIYFSKSTYLQQQIYSFDTAMHVFHNVAN